MGEFFKPLRRKLGCLALLMACLLMGAWARSLTLTDSCFFSVSGIWQVGFVSNYGQFSLGVVRFPDDIPFRYNVAKHSGPICIETVPLMFDFIGHAKHRVYTQKVSQPIFSYWYFVIPLTLISLWLLFSKPCSSIQKKITEPIPPTVG